MGEVHDRNASFWKTSHHRVADFEKLLCAERDMNVCRTDITSTLLGLLVENVKRVWSALDKPLVRAIANCEVVPGISRCDAFAGAVSRTPARLDVQQRGTYEPPAFTACNVTSVASRKSAVPQLVSDPDLEWFLRGLDTCGSDFSRSSFDRQAPPVPNTEKTDVTESMQPLAYASVHGKTLTLSSAYTGDAKPQAPIDRDAPVTSFQAFDPESFFKEWGIDVDSDEQQTHCKHARHTGPDVVDLDTFLDACLEDKPVQSCRVADVR